MTTDAIQKSVRALTGTSLTYEEDWHTLWDNAGIADGVFGERMLAWLNVELGASYGDVNDAMRAFALTTGKPSFGEVNSLGIKATMNAIADKREGGNIILMKARASGSTEYHVFLQQEPGGAEYTRWVVSNQTNAGGAGTGMPRVCYGTRALIPTKTGKALPTVITDATGGADGVNGATVVEASEGVEVGTWSTSTIAGMTLRWSSTPGDTKTYTVTGAALLHFRGYATTNGDDYKVDISPAPVEWLMPTSGSDHVTTTRASGSAVGLTAAAGARLDPTETYTVVTTVIATNGARAYQGGLLLWGEGWETTAGAYGSLVTITGDYAISRYKNDRIIYEHTDVTRIVWKYRSGTDMGVVNFKLYDASGNEVTPDVTQQDCYNGTTAYNSVTVSADLPRGTYYHHVLNDGSKNASSSQTWIGHSDITDNFTGYGYNDLVGGDPETADIDILDGLVLANSSESGTSDYVGYDATIERVMAVCKTSESSAGLVGGVHGNETLGAMTFKVDGVTVDYAGASANDRFVGTSSVQVTFGTTLLFPSDASQFGTAAYTQTWDKNGYTPDIVDTLTADVKMGPMYAPMHSYPSTRSGNSGIGGGFGNVLLQPSGAFTYAPSVVENELTTAPLAVATYNDDYVFTCIPESYEAARAVFSGISGANAGGRQALIYDNGNAGSPTNRNKVYWLVIDPSALITVPSATTWTTSARWDAVKIADFGGFVT